MRGLIVYIGEEAFAPKGRSAGTYKVRHRIEVPYNKIVFDMLDNEMHTEDCECHGKLPTLLMHPFGEAEFDGFIEGVEAVRSKLSCIAPKDGWVIPLVSVLDSCLRLVGGKPKLFLYWM